MTRRSVLPVFLAALLSLIVSSLHAEVLFGPVTVPNGQVYTGTFPMYCRCTAYFLEVTSQSSKTPMILLNGEQVLQLGGEEWRKAAVQVELREDAPNEIEIRVGRTQGRAGATVQVVERDVTPAPMPAREYVKDSTTPEEYHESFVLNHWASRFVLRVENGDPDGSHRVTSGTVRVNGQEVLGPDQLHGGMAEADAEVELRTDIQNRVRVRVEGPAGAKIRIGIEEPAQTVTVTQVAEVELPYGRDESGIQMHDGHVLLRVRDGEELLEINEMGGVIQRLANNDRRMGEEVIETMSPRLGYVLTVARVEGERVFRLYDRNWSLVSTITGQDLWITAISEAGGYLLGWDRATYHLPACQGCMAAIYDPSLTVRTTIPVGMMPIDADRENQFSPDEQTTYTHCDDKLQVYRTDGTFLWEAPWRQSRHLGNGGIAVQASADSLLLHDATGALVRRVVNPRPPEQSGEPRARTTPGGEHALHSGDAVLVARREGPQSCWLFDPGPEGYICWQSMSDDGRWIVAIDAGGKPREVSLVGAGGHVVWELDDQWFCGPLQRMLAPDGGYFYLFTRDSQSGPCKYCHVYRIDVE